ncbi:MAG: hypothetical protein AB7E52_00565 [Bdellovibrionales bacterium]
MSDEKSSPSFFLVRRFILIGLSVALGVGLCVHVIAKAEISTEDWRALALSFSLFWSVVVFLLSHAMMVTGARKWELLSRALHPVPQGEPEHRFYLRHYLWQNWIGQFVPSSFAIILGRGWASRHLPRSMQKKKARPFLSGVWSGLLDQALEFFILLGFLGGSVWVLFFNGNVIDFFLGAVAGLAAQLLFFFLVRRWLPQNYQEIYWPVIGLSFVRVGLMLTRLIAGVKASGVFLSTLKVAAIASPISVLSIVPLTPGNVGVVEWGWQASLVWAGEGIVAATLYAAFFRVLILVVQSVLLGLNEAYVAYTKN